MNDGHDRTPAAQGTEPPGLDGLLRDLERLIGDRERVLLGEVLDTLGARGHGPILLVLAALMMLPTGLLPLMPALIGGLIALTAVEMIAGGKGVSVPPRLARIALPGALLRGSLRRGAPFARRVGRVLHPCWPVFVRSQAVQVVLAAILLMASAVMIVIGAIPGLPFLLVLPALLFGLGLTAGDGRLVAAGLLATGLVGWGIAALL